MKEISKKAQERYLCEIAIRLNSAGVTVQPVQDDSLPVEYDGAYLCCVSGKGDVFYRESDTEGEPRSAVLHRVVGTASEVNEYMRLMEAAPPLKAKGLDGDYRLLADFGGAVLAGHPTSHGAEFVTWDWDYEHTGMWQGHYYGNNYAGAKQDFAVRSGLIPQDLIFEQEQLDDIYRCLQKTRELDDTLTYQGEQKIIKAQEHIETISPRRAGARRGDGDETAGSSEGKPR